MEVDVVSEPAHEKAADALPEKASKPAAAQARRRILAPRCREGDAAATVERYHRARVWKPPFGAGATATSP
jgi:hypothetical protein